MFSKFRYLMMIAIVGGCALMFSPEPQQAVANDGYWKNYWSWYDGNYRPYYNRSYRNYGNYNYGNYNYGYNNPYSSYGSYYGRGYNPYLGNRYNNSPYYNYYSPYQRRNSISLGDFQFSWR